MASNNLLRRTFLENTIQQAKRENWSREQLYQAQLRINMDKEVMKNELLMIEFNNQLDLAQIQLVFFASSPGTGNYFLI